MRVQASVVAPSDGPWCRSWPATVGRGLVPHTSAHTLACLARATQLRWNRRNTKLAVRLVHGGAADVVERPPPGVPPHHGRHFAPGGEGISVGRPRREQ